MASLVPTDVQKFREITQSFEWVAKIQAGKCPFDRSLGFQANSARENWKYEK